MLKVHPVLYCSEDHEQVGVRPHWKMALTQMICCWLNWLQQPSDLDFESSWHRVGFCICVLGLLAWGAEWLFSAGTPQQTRMGDPPMLQTY